MSYRFIPKENKNWKGTFPGNYNGDIWQTRNIDLHRNPGRLGLADKMFVMFDDTDTNLTNLGVIDKFIRTNADNTDRWWGLASAGRMFNSANTSPFSTWAVDALSNSPTDALDMEVHEEANGEQRLVVTRDADIAILNRTGAANAWTASWWQGTLAQAALTSGVPHPIARLQRLIAIGDKNKIHTIDSADTVVNADLTFPSGYSNLNIYSSTDRFWIGLQHNFGGNARIVEWDGFSTTYNNEYDLVGSYPLCGFIAQGVPYFITEYGYIFRFNGSSFAEVQRFPMDDFQFEAGLGVVPTIRPYAAQVDRNLVHILINAPLLSRRMRSGIWTFDTQSLNLYHKMALSSQKSDGTEYDFGQSPVHRIGGLKMVHDLNSLGNPLSFIAGGTFYVTYTGTTREGIWRMQYNKRRASDGGIQRGHFITPYISTTSVDEMWEALWLKFRKFVSSSNRIVVKVRNADPLIETNNSDGRLLQATGTWTSTTTFTSVVPTGVTVGDEVEILSGNGAGSTFHISTLSATPDGSATITVTVDEALTDLRDSGERGMLARYDDWIKVGTISDTTIGNDKLEMPEAIHGEFAQFKIELRGFEVEIDELIPVFKSKTKPDQA